MTTTRVPASGWRSLLFGVAVSYLAHAGWEVAQMSLYVSPIAKGFVPILVHCGLKAAGGDLLLMGILYLMLALTFRSWKWSLEGDSFRHPATWVLTPAVGALLAISFELWAVYVDHRWVYAASMPLVPVLAVGLTPVLQMVLVPLWS